MCRYPFQPIQVRHLYPNSVFEGDSLENQRHHLHLHKLTKILKRCGLVGVQWIRSDDCLRMVHRVGNPTGS